MSEQVWDTGEVIFPVPHAAGREREEKPCCQGLLLSFYIPFILDERFPPFVQEFCSAVPFSSIPLLRSRYPFSITCLKGGLL